MKFVITDGRSIIKQVVSGTMIFFFILFFIAVSALVFLVACAVYNIITMKGIIILFSIVFFVMFAISGNDIWRWSNNINKHSKQNKKVK